MSKRGKLPLDVWETYKTMSEDVGRVVPFMQETSMMSPRERKLIAYCQTAKEVFKEDKEFVNFLDSFIIPFLTKLGRSLWNRDIVSDLGFALAGRRGAKKKLGDLLNYEPTEDV